MIGQRLGRLLVTAEAEPRTRVSGGRQRKRRMFKCLCDCGNEASLRMTSVQRGHAKSCGCLSSELTARGRNLKHGHSPIGSWSSTYRSWMSMLQRTRAKSGHHFTYYGSRGITVCALWSEFDNFLADMGERPAGKTIDRVDNDGNYEPGNCKWSTKCEQMVNRRPFVRERWRRPPTMRINLLSAKGITQ